MPDSSGLGLPRQKKWVTWHKTADGCNSEPLDWFSCGCGKSVQNPRPPLKRKSILHRTQAENSTHRTAATGADLHFLDFHGFPPRKILITSPVCVCGGGYCSSTAVCDTCASARSPTIGGHGLARMLCCLAAPQILPSAALSKHSYPPILSHPAVF